MILRSIWCKRGVHKKESLRRTGMVKWMSTPDSLYSVVLCRVYGFLAGCKGMRRKNAGNKRLMIGEGVCGGGINSIRVIRIFLSFFLSSLPSSMTNWKRHKKGRVLVFDRRGCLCQRRFGWGETKRRMYVGNFSYYSVLVSSIDFSRPRKWWFRVISC